MKISDIEIADDVEISSSALGRGRFQLQLVGNTLPCSCVPPGMNRAVNICRKLGLSAPHPRRIKVAHRFPHFFFRGSALLSAERERAVQNKVRHTFRVPHCIGNEATAPPWDIPRSGKRLGRRLRRRQSRGRSPRRRARAYRRPSQTCHCLSRRNEPACMAARQSAKDMMRHTGLSPIVFKMVHPVTRLHKERSAA